MMPRRSNRKEVEETSCHKFAPFGARADSDVKNATIYIKWSDHLGWALKKYASEF